MADSRFYESLGPLRLADIADRVGGRLLRPGDGDAEISGAGAWDDEAADPTSSTTSGPASGVIGFLADAKKLSRLETSNLAACLVDTNVGEALAAGGVRLVAVARPQAAFARACALLTRPREDAFGDTGVHPRADVASDARVASGARVGQGAVIGAGARIGANAVIGPGVVIGEHADIGPGAVVRFAEVGARTVIRANAVVGEAGFGLTQSDEGLIDLPHLGRVLIGEDVLIGAATTIDRGMLSDTTIGDRTKIDNLVQIAHNVRIGRGCILAGCCGISGSVVIEDGATLGGSVGVSDHVVVGARAILVGATLVMRDVPAGERWAGAPARPARRFFREMVALERLARGPKS